MGIYGAMGAFPLSGLALPVTEGAALAPRTTWRIGGPARWLVQPVDGGGLGRLLAAWPGDVPLMVLGGGSNLLIDDAGFSGLVVDLTGHLSRIETVTEAVASSRWGFGPKDVGKDNVIVRAEAGASTRSLAHYARRRGLAGAAFLAGIPGSVGGALRMNAGAHGGEMKDILLAVEMMDPAGKPHRRVASHLGLAYRQARVPAGWLFLSALLRFRPGDPGAIRERMRGFNRRRRATQPLAFPSAGSTFKNPPEGPRAWQWIDAAGMRGTREGDAQVSEQHSNFFINCGRANSRDMRVLIDRVRERVLQTGGISLALEVGILGPGGLETDI